MKLRHAHLLALAFALAAGACTPHPRPATTPAPHWLGTWMSSQQLVEPRNMPPAPLANSTLRQVIHVSLGGPRIRLALSNLFGNGPVAIGAARIARSAGGSAIERASQRALTFGGADSVTIAAGQAVTSDPLDFPVSPLSNLAVTLRIGVAPGELTGHPGSRTTSYIKAGDWVSAPDLADAATTEHWYLIAGLDVAAEGSAVVTLGNSITDGHGAGTNKDDRWPDVLARRLQANPRTTHIAVLNAGIGGNCILKYCLGPAALARLDRDVLDQRGVRWAIVLEGVNDIGGTRSPAAADSVATGLIAAFQQIIREAHARGLRISGATILPFGGSFYDRPGHEEARQRVNEWIRTSGAFDAVVDFDAVMRDPTQPNRLLPIADSGDHLHPGEEGYRMMADAIDLALFTR
ncbi:MAG TPA: SGNH/GDSL hydrolase family protein [Gemmatimonadales bacterium]|nr:SGNH/GDSL hydrolase family protein [Gemmatimonadales bacterium]